MAEITSELLEVTVDTDHTVEIDSKLPEVVVDIAKSITVEIQPENYVLTSGGMYTGNMTGATPTWLLNAIEQQLTTGDGNLMSVLDAMQTLLNSVQLGVNQAISQIENTNVSMSALETSLGSRLNDNSAAILDVYATRVTATEAQAIATTAIGATFGGNVDAYIGNLASVYTAPGSATATNIATLQVSYNDQTARIDTVESITIENSTAIKTLETTTGISIDELQAQIDGVIDSWYYSYVPDQSNFPWSDWLAIDTLNANTVEQTRHLGDLFYDLTTGTAYRFASSGGVYGWAVVTDTAITLALAEASNAQYTADGKASVYYSSTAPIPKVVNGVTIPIEIGDMWVNSNTKIVKVAIAISPTIVWADSTNTATENALLALTDLEEARDGNVVVYYKLDTTGPVGMEYGDYMVDTDSWNGSSYTVYRYENSVGRSIGTLAWYANTGDTAKALSSGYRAQVLAGAAQSTADGKVKTWYQASAPTLTASDIGDYWIDTDNANKMQVWSGTAWKDPTSAQGTTAYNWSATASKLITAPDGSVTGWSFGDGSNTKSNFKIKAQNFSISDGITGYTPFSITGSDINFLGKVSFNSVTGAPSGGSNLLYNSAPMLANETKGWSIGWYNTGIVPVIGAGSDPWRPSGGGSVYAAVPGAPTVGTAFDVAQTTKVPVIGGTWYEASVYISSHKCTSYVTIAWYDSNNAYIGKAGGTDVSGASSGALANWGRSTLMAQAPANAARAHFYVRSAVSGTDPYCFVAFAYLGQAVQGQAVFSDWNEGTSAGVSSGEVVNAINSGDTTTINGGRITTGSITTNTIALGTGIVNGYIQSSDFAAIGGAGFRLKSNAAGTAVDPSIYGAYIKGCTIEGDNIVGQNLVKVHAKRLTDLYASAIGSQDIISYTFTITTSKTVLVNVDSHYIVSSGSLEDGYDTMRAELLVNGSSVYASINHTVPYTHTYLTSLAAGTHTVAWKLIEVSSVGQEVTLSYDFRAMTITEIKT